MKLTPQLREAARLRILHAVAGHRFGAPENFVQIALQTDGFDMSATDVAEELDYLSDPKKGLVIQVDKRISPEVRHWKITAEGRDFLAQNE